MSRTKKSRKPGTGSIGMLKDDKKKLAQPAPRKAKKKKGKEAGNRQKEAQQKSDKNTHASANKDPRIGNKTPIDLGKPSRTPSNTKTDKSKEKTQANSPIAAIRTAEPVASLAEQLRAIEQDSKLLEIIEKQDTNTALTSIEVDYFNDLMTQHEKLSQLLGLDDENDAEAADMHQPTSEDALWDKLDQSDLSKFE
ncbi:hypothetical protein SAMN05216262_11253 [Colwellia chukchiensis]|uniref:Der GTPase-activating protein YihI n=1 Tax=Colwellia chukchiensis TaxID=641665 RepID=A0A1H7QP37_9GAMM|nr:Der GTPase-activating protein YihI [Colwellia chukchiensis]SEL49736.1 hypothetical protein SAMN05216262_11253 [Colwellia chukchiensis]